MPTFKYYKFTISSGVYMRFLSFICFVVLFSGLVISGCPCSESGSFSGKSEEPSEVGSVVAKGPGYNVSIQSQNQTQAQVQAGVNQTQGQVQNQNKTPDQDKNQTGQGKPVLVSSNSSEINVSNGISAQVRQIVAARKNGSITVPQGFLVRIIAKNQSFGVNNESFQLNETLQAHVSFGGKNKSLILKSVSKGVNITEGNMTATALDNVDIENDSMYMGNKKVVVSPSEVPQKFKAKLIKSAILSVSNGTPVYQVNSTRGVKLFGFIDSDMDVETILDATTGNIKQENKPWWAFLASEN